MFNRSWRRPLLIGAAAVAVASVVGGVAYSAGVATQQPAIQTSTPRSEHQITNIDVLRQQIRNYYGDPLGTGIFGADSNYAKEATSVATAGQALAGEQAPHPRHQGDPARRRRHLAGDLELRDRQQLGVQPDHQRPLRHRAAVPGGPGHGRPGDDGRARGLRDLLPDRARRRPGSGDARQPDRGRDRRRRRLPEADHPAQRRGRPVHQAGAWPTTRTT